MNKIVLTATALLIAGLGFAGGYTLAAQNGDQQVAHIEQAAHTLAQKCAADAEVLIAWHAPEVIPTTECVLRSQATVNDYLTMRCICG